MVRQQRSKQLTYSNSSNELHPVLLPSIDLVLGRKDFHEEEHLCEVSSHIETASLYDNI